MKRFTFSLEALLEKRKREEENVKLELAKKNKEIYEAQNELHDFKEQLSNLQNDQKQIRKKVTDVLSLKVSVSFRNKLKLDMLKKGENIQLLKKQQEDIRQKLVNAKQKKKAIELIRNKKYKEWSYANKIREQVFIDDVSQIGFIRKKNASKDTSTL